MKQIVKEWKAVDKFKLFEIPVINKQTSEKDYILFDLELQEDKKQLIASHESLTKEQTQSKYIAYVFISVDPEFTLDENLQELYDECLAAILQSDYFNLAE